MCVCLSLCLSVCLSVGLCVKAKCVDMSARIATKLHTRAKNLPGKVLNPFRSAGLMGSGGNSASSLFNWHKVWTVVKCHFSSVHHHDQYVVGKLSINRVRVWNFTRIERKTKKLRLSINPARRQWPEPPTKRCELPLFFAGIRQAERRWKALDLGSLNIQFQQDWPKDEKITAFLNFCRKT